MRLVASFNHRVSRLGHTVRTNSDMLTKSKELNIKLRAAGDPYLCQLQPLTTGAATGRSRRSTPAIFPATIAIAVAAKENNAPILAAS
ncbi:hypothetical protein DEV91_10918 [Phyllobacterium brassicacearum]|nr:hypothetical protein DEV91_10918 [Phyllobacterium brassicacearum]